MRNDRQEFSKRRAKRTKSQRVCGGGLGWVHAKFLHLTHFRYNRASFIRQNFHLSVQSNSESLLFGFTLLHLAIGTENSYYFLNRSDPKLKQRRNSYSYFPALKTVFMTPDRNAV